MIPQRLEIFTFRSAGAEVGRLLGIDVPPECKRDHGRVYFTFRRLGATRWSEADQMAFARRTVELARGVLATHRRRELRTGARRAIVVIYEDATVVQGCAVTARWECTVPGTT